MWWRRTYSILFEILFLYNILDKKLKTVKTKANGTYHLIFYFQKISLKNGIL